LHTVGGVDVLTTEPLAPGTTPNGFQFEAGVKTSLSEPGKQTAILKVGNFNFEVANTGKSKFGMMAYPGIWAESEVNPRAGEMLGGINFKGGDFIQGLFKNKDFDRWTKENPKASEWIEQMRYFELYFGIGFTGTREETILAIVSNAPGFFQRREPVQLFAPNILWNKLSHIEQVNLVTLGWDRESWDYKYYKQGWDKRPESTKKFFNNLSAEEKVAIVHLGFHAYEDYKKLLENIYSVEKEKQSNQA
jgi:hypothetical protein